MKWNFRGTFLGIAFEDDSGNLLKDQLSNPRGFRLLENSPIGSFTDGKL